MRTFGNAVRRGSSTYSERTSTAVRFIGIEHALRRRQMNQPWTRFSVFVRISCPLAILLGALMVLFSPAAAFADTEAAAGASLNDRGRVLSVRSMQLSPAIANVATGKRITYAS